MPLDPKVEREEKGRNAHTSIKDSIQNPHADAKLEKKPKWAQTTLQDVRNLVGDPINTRRNRYDFEEPPIALTATEPFPSMNIFLVQPSDPQSYGEAIGNPFLEYAMQEE